MVGMDVAFFWDTAQCNQHMNRRFGETYRLHLQGWISAEQETNVQQVAPLIIDTHTDYNVLLPKR
jgi:hypothetical protein